MTATALSAISALVQARSGIVLGEDKGYMLETRLAPLLRRHGLRDLQLLASRLQGPGAQGLAREGVLFQGAHILSAAFGGREIGALLKAYDRVLPALVDQFHWPRRRVG